MHSCAGLGEKVLNDDLLDVAVSSVRRSDGLQGDDPIVSVLTDPDQEPSGEWDGELSCCIQGGQPACRQLVRCATVAVEALDEGLHHHPLGGGDPPESG